MMASSCVNTIKTSSAFALIFLLGACSSVGAKYRPQVNGGDLAHYDSDLAQCQQLAKNVKGNTKESTAIGAFIGGLAGASDSSEATIAGAAIGAIVGAVSGDYQTKEAQKKSVITCMQAKGYNVVDSKESDN